MSGKRRRRRGKSKSGSNIVKAVVKENVAEVEQFISNLDKTSSQEKDRENKDNPDNTVDISIYLNLSCLVLQSKLLIGKINYIRVSVGYEMINASNLTVIVNNKKVRPHERIVVTYEDLMEFSEKTKREKFGYYSIGITSDGLHYLKTFGEIKGKDILTGTVGQDGSATLCSEYSRDKALAEAVHQRLQAVLSCKWDDGFQD